MASGSQNDPRGSWSDFVGSWELHKFGPATKTNEKRSLAHDPHDRRRRLSAKTALKYPPVRFDQAQRDVVADGFATAIAEGNYLCHACCIGYDHAHLVLARSDRSIEVVAGHLKAKASMALSRQGIHPLRQFAQNGRTPTPWSEGCWSVFINDPEQLGAAIAYVERHPIKEGLSQVRYAFVPPV